MKTSQRTQGILLLHNLAITYEAILSNEVVCPMGYCNPATLPFVQFQGTLNKCSKITKRGKFVVIWDAWLALTSTQLCLLCCSIMPSWAPFGSAVHTDGNSELIGQANYMPEWPWMQHDKIQSCTACWQFSGLINGAKKNDLWIWLKYRRSLNISKSLTLTFSLSFTSDEVSVRGISHQNTLFLCYSDQNDPKQTLEDKLVRFH